MSPSPIYQNQDLQQSRPSPLKIKKDSHFIQKSSSSSSSSSVASSSLTTLPKQQQQQLHPVIIYTHSPRVIHTKARDFMALVQKLTGLENDQSSIQPAKDGNVNANKKKLASEDNDSSSIVTGDENCSKNVVDQEIGGNNNSPNFMIDLPILNSTTTTTTDCSSLYYPSSRPSFYTFPNSLPNPLMAYTNFIGGNFNGSLNN